MPLATKKDYILVSIIGLFFALLLLPIMKNVKLTLFELNILNVAIFVLVFIVFANIALWMAFLISRKIPIALQFAKFGAAGALSTLLDLGILNSLIFFTGFAAGWHYSLYKSISFIVANINAYFWNKHWTFKAGGESNVKEFGQFFAVSLIGFGINVSLASLIVNIIGPIGNISIERWGNIGALAATIISLIWNFVGYKFLVFRK
ncbi:MAG: hypothetical protein UT92_C0001G0063 [Candidatus Curtissbacteria bacterium GW2011_GWA1_40_24]|uniref:GtrA/DPMS transmembrane domain-containing protein n=2 Tax=Patescibacteria group TaxID=1783273 RepID=A0A0G0U8C4_9BACT|nr:MAG: hypothetical protein UT92_C0001G0063 [Candidatus Curtissbacteria bacterium GW2011_GWA1_40_24]KKR89060.1 MAG: hypothetical protein UU38_C0002G0063 [Candidatus Wolfebacteria bacterium GW2011_GWB1_41_12]